ncbi:hypothetical protein Q1695_010234 [Nippostrongylus brasiliensis]|nr:hypothetical protein Q1695_010234 [Nippostrongylus brasiliensis]
MSKLQHTPAPAAMDLSLVPLEKGFVPGASQTLEEFHQQPMHLLTEKLELTGETRWTEWSEWADCFCGKQVRTRRCLYTGVMSQGCQGDSYESRSCVGGSCPISVPSTSAYPIQITSSSPSPDDIHRQFRPLKLNTAISLS